jgi:predicted GNAT family N-acyltransferase
MSRKYNLGGDKYVKTHIFFNPVKTGDLEDIKYLLNYDEENDAQYKDISNYIMRVIDKSEFLCKGVNKEYVMESFDKVDAVIVIGSSMNILPNGNIYGFALIQFDEMKNLLYIDLICSHNGIRGAGIKMLKEIEKVCNKLMMDIIKLTSIESAIPFYEKYGFVKKTSSCKDMCIMTKTVVKKSSSKSPKSPRSSKSPRTRKSRK